MRNHSFKISTTTLTAATIAACIASTPVLAEGWYTGVDIVSQRTTLDYTTKSEDYVTQHIRIKLGYAFNENFSLEARAMSDANDTDTHTGGNLFRWRSGLTASLYGRVTIPMDFRIGHIDGYLLFGASSMDTTYTNTVANTSSTEKVSTFDFGLGAEYRVNKKLSLALEGRIFRGTADYSTFFTNPDSVSVTGKSLSLGTTYRF